MPHTQTLYPVPADIYPGPATSSEGFVTFNVTSPQYGATGGGVVDDTAALQAAATAAAAVPGGWLVFPPGNYKTSAPITFFGPVLSYGGATIEYTGTGAAVILDLPTTGPQAGIVVYLPHVKQMAQLWAPGAPSTDSGILILNSVGNEIHIPYVAFFTNGYDCSPNGTGTNGTGAVQDNNIFIGELVDNMRNQRIAPSSTGYYNANNHYGGSFEPNQAYGAGASGTRGILISEAANQVTGNKWFGPDLEGTAYQYAVECWGADNTIEAGYWEGPVSVAWRSSGGNTAARNVIDGGYAAGALTVVTDSGVPVNLNPIRGFGGPSAQNHEAVYDSALVYGRGAVPYFGSLTLGYGTGSPQIAASLLESSTDYGTEAALGAFVNNGGTDPVIKMFADAANGVVGVMGLYSSAVPFVLANGNVEFLRFAGTLVSIPSSNLGVTYPAGGNFRIIVGASEIQLAGLNAVPLLVQTNGHTGFQISAAGGVGLYAATPVAQPSAIAAPTGGSTIDTQARTAITSILNALGAAAGGIGVTA